MAEIKKTPETIQKEGGVRGEGQFISDDTKKMFDARCAICGKAIQVPFRPDPKKLCYCKEHLEMIKNDASHDNPRSILNKAPLRPPYAAPRPPSSSLSQVAEYSGREDGSKDQELEHFVQAPVEKIKEVSLKEAVQTEAQRFGAREKVIPPKIRREVNLNELKKNIENTKHPDVNLQKQDRIDEKKIEENKTGQPDNNKGSLSPGERITFE